MTKYRPSSDPVRQTAKLLEFCAVPRSIVDIMDQLGLSHRTSPAVFLRCILKGLQHWIDAQKRFRLNHGQIQMARELGMNPKKFGKLANHRQEPWKLPLPQFIEALYFKHFGKRSPDRVLPLEDWAREKKQKKEEGVQRFPR